MRRLEPFRERFSAQEILIYNVDPWFSSPSSVSRTMAEAKMALQGKSDIIDNRGSSYSAKKESHDGELSREGQILPPKKSITGHGRQERWGRRERDTGNGRNRIDG
jgi:hypothetical protein